MTRIGGYALAAPVLESQELGSRTAQGLQSAAMNG